MSSKKTTIPGQSEHIYLVLDALRGVAAITITCAHYIEYASNDIIKWPPAAQLAVDFFYILSGFVVAHAYEKHLLSGLTATRFMLRRLIRLYPLYWLGLTIAFVVFLFSGYPYTRSYWFSIFFLPSPRWIMAHSAVKFLYPLNWRNGTKPT